MALATANATVFLDRLLATRAVEPAQAAVVVRDLETGELLDDHNGSELFIPASILKTVTIASLLGEAGCSDRFETLVRAHGKVKDGVLEGNLVVIGSGDPTINAGCEPAGADFLSEIADALEKAGIREIKGKVEIDADCFTAPAIPPSWAAADTRQKYGTGCHGFNFRHNATGPSAVADPKGLFRTELLRKLRSRGIAVAESADVKPAGKPATILTHRSATMDEVMRSCMMRSDNLFAEALLRRFAIAKGRKGDTAQAAELEKEFWGKRGLDTGGFTIVDGSGLSRSNRVSAQFIEGVLKEMGNDPDFASFLPLAGQEGTLKSFLKDTPLDSYIALKTGSMNGIQCYAGYKLDEDFVPTHSVVVILNALPKGRAAARAAVETYLLGLFAE